MPQTSNSRTTDLSGYKDLQNRILFLLGALIVFRIGSHIPVPGVDAVALERLHEDQSGGILSILNVFSGGSLWRFSIFAIGIMPYISASIIVQLAAEIIPSLQALKKEGEAGKRVLMKYTRYGTVFLAILQSFAAATFVLQQDIVVLGRAEFYTSTVVVLVTGTLFLMWLGEQITGRGIGNGISLIITAGIVSALPSTLAQIMLLTSQGSVSYLITAMIVVGIAVLAYIVVYVEMAQRKVPVHYMKRQIGNKVTQRQSSYIPLKLNMAGVMPPIFASSIILFPATILSWLGSLEGSSSWIRAVAPYLQHGHPVYIALFAVAIVFFCYFYTALVFSPREMAENLKKSGGFVPGIRPGERTSFYFEKVVQKVTLWGAVYITVVCLVPEMMTSTLNIPFYLGGTSLLIIIVVAMDLQTQIYSHVVSRQYQHLMKKQSGAKLLNE